MTELAQSSVKTRRSGPHPLAVIVTLLVSVAAVLGALFAIDGWVRQQVSDIVTTKVHEVLSLESTQPVAVNIAGFSVIAQVLTGSFDEVSVAVDQVTIGDLTGDVTLRATGIPVDLAKPVEKVQIVFSVDEKNLQSIAHLLSASAIEKVELVDTEIRFASALRFFGFSFDVGIGVEPFADHGQIGFTPTSIELGGSRMSADELVDRLGPIAESLLQARSVCVARWLPAALTVDEVVVRDKELVLTIGADRQIFSESSLGTFGTCEDSR